MKRLKRQASDGLSYSEYRSRMAGRSIYGDNRYNDRYRNYGRYDERYRSYDDRYDDRPYDRDRYRYMGGRGRTYPCGR